MSWPCGGCGHRSPHCHCLAPYTTTYTPPSIQEQAGTDPISKLAKAVERLADALDKSK